MTDRRVDLDLATGLNDGTSWANAYQGAQGFETAQGVAAAGDRIFVKDASSGNSGSSILLNNDLGLAACVNPVQVIAVRSDAADAVAKTDVILGLREGNATRAYAQTGAEAPPKLLDTSQAITWNGASYYYGFIFDPGSNSNVANLNAVEHCLTFEECHFDVASGGQLTLGGADNYQRFATFKNCLFTMGARQLRGPGTGLFEFYNCIFTGTLAGFIRGQNRFIGTFKFYDCDFSGCNATMVNIAAFLGGRVEFHNCKMPLNHILTTGVATGFYTVVNYGSEDSTGLTSTDSEQALEIHTHQGTVDIETTAVRTGGASDGATGGFAYALAANNISDNFVGVVSPWRYKWIEGDGTAKTLSVFIANDDTEAAGNLIEDDEIFLEVGFPSEAGISMYDYLPDEGAPGDGGGRMQLLGTAADIATDGSTWGTGANNKQKLTQSLAPDYQGPLYWRVHFSKSATPPILFLDPLAQVA